MIKKILVVDNNPLIVKFMEKTLAAKGYQVVTAGDGLSALELMDTCTPDLVFVDLVMPKISGEKLCRTMRSRPHLKDIPVVILSSLAAEEQKTMTREADAYIAKGPLQETAAHVFSVIDHLEKGSGVKLDRVIGAERLQQREVTRELLAINRHLEVIFDNMSEGIFEITDGDKIIYVNPAASHLVELAEERLLSRSLADIFAENFRQRLAELIGKVTATRQEVQGEELELHGRILSLNFLPIAADTGASIIVMAQDVTERRRAQRSLVRSAAQYRNLAEHANDGICIVQDGRLKYVNQQLLKMGDYHLADLVGVPVTRLIPSDSLDEVQRWYEAFQTDREDEGLRFESCWLHRDASRIEVECNVSATEYDGRRAALVVVRDITGRRQAERQLRQAHRFLQSVIDGMSESIMVIGTDYRVRMMNKVARILYGEPGTEEPFCHQLLHGLDQPCAEVERCPLGNVVRTGKPFATVKTRQDPKGEIRSAEIFATPVFSDRNEITGIIEVARDISERLRLEEERKQLEARLFQQQKEESISTLAGGIAHDFNNILTSVLGYAELLHRSPAVPEKERGLASNVVESVRRMVKLTRQMESYIKRGKQQPQEVSLNTLLQEVLVLAGKEKRVGIIYDLQLAEDLWPVGIDPSQITQALINILTNGIEAMGQGPGTMTIRTHNEVRSEEWECQANIRLPAGAYVHLEIGDTGPGIPADSLDRIFEPYFSTKFIGRGLGLAATLGIINNHHGGIRVESSAERGTLFHVYLPRAAKGQDAV
ncbi:MAG: PAS domain S-box protein [Desulfobulbaceae bacterium]|nr:PAS domain S-box protein [Desulfobulbaceae bacterium]